MGCEPIQEMIVIVIFLHVEVWVINGLNQTIDESCQIASPSPPSLTWVQSGAHVAQFSPESQTPSPQYGLVGVGAAAYRLAEPEARADGPDWRCPLGSTAAGVVLST